LQTRQQSGQSGRHFGAVEANDQELADTAPYVRRAVLSWHYQSLFTYHFIYQISIFLASFAVKGS
jgi:hypothetical protein